MENGIDDYTAADFFNSIIPIPDFGRKYKDIMLKDIVSDLPDILYFLKHGDKCATECGVSCFYCEECAKKLEDILYV